MRGMRESAAAAQAADGTAKAPVLVAAVSAGVCRGRIGVSHDRLHMCGTTGSALRVAGQRLLTGIVPAAAVAVAVAVAIEFWAKARGDRPEPHAARSRKQAVVSTMSSCVSGCCGARSRGWPAQKAGLGMRLNAAEAGRVRSVMHLHLRVLVVCAANAPVSMQLSRLLRLITAVPESKLVRMDLQRAQLGTDCVTQEQEHA